MSKLMKSGRGLLFASVLLILISGIVPTAMAIQLVCSVDVEKVVTNPRVGIVGLRANILDSAGNVTGARIWQLCRTEISDGLRATLDPNIGSWTSEEDCRSVLNTLNLAKALDRTIQIVFREAPDNTDPTLEAVTCEDVKSQDPVLFKHLHQISWAD